MKNSRFFLKSMMLIMVFALFSVKLLAQDKITLVWHAEANETKLISAASIGWFIIDWGDGATQEIEGGKRLEYTYKSAGTYTVTITAMGDSRLMTLFCELQKVSGLTINDCSKMRSIDLGYNSLKLSDLYQVQFIHRRFLYKQVLPSQTAFVGEELFADQSIFDGKYTEYQVTKYGSKISTEDYLVVDGKLIFNTEGEYGVCMLNDTITFWDTKMVLLMTVKVYISRITIYKLNVPNNKLSKIKIYPNPTTDFVYIKTEDDNIPEVKLYSTNGKLLQHIHNTKIDLSDYAKGVYILSINGNYLKIVKN